MGGDSILFTRHDGNPIITAANLPYRANTVFNPGAVQVGDETLLLLRVEDMRGISHLTVARSPDGLDDWTIDPEPTFRPDPDQHPEELWGIEDPRITWLPDENAWAVVFTAYSRRGPLVSMALTEDFRTFRRLGATMPPDDKDAALFPRKFDGRWAIIHRPTPNRGGANIWLSYSPDLRHWGDLTLLIEAREGAWWDAGKVGLGPPPLETDEGWLVLYHGVHLTASGALYRCGLALLDADDPRRVLRRTPEWVLGPSETYEQVGDVVGVVFPCGWIIGPDGDELRLYYGAADTSVCVAVSRVSQILDYLRDAPAGNRVEAARSIV
jgi:predicted GH43/DUF377 family glycosyl hydrolase